MESAIKENDLEKVKKFLEGGYGVNVQNEEGDTLLHLAVANNNDREILELLLQSGADSKIRNKRNMSPYECIVQGAIKLIENILILEYSFDLRR